MFPMKNYQHQKFSLKKFNLKNEKKKILKFLFTKHLKNFLRSTLGLDYAIRRGVIVLKMADTKIFTKVDEP